MKRLTERLSAARARLAFRRAPASPANAGATLPVPDAPALAGVSGAIEDTPPQGRRRPSALLPEKSVWILSASLAILAPLGAPGAAQRQPAQDRAAQETKSKTVEQPVELAARPAPPAPTPPPAASVAPGMGTPAAGSAKTARTAAPRSAPAESNCDIRDAEGVSLRLKDCIDAFNQAPAAGTRTERPPRTP